MSQSWWGQGIAKFVSARSPWSALAIHTRSASHWHGWWNIPIHIRSTSPSTSRPHTRCWVQRRTIIHWAAHAISIPTSIPGVLPCHLESRILRTLLRHSHSRVRHWRRTFRSGKIWRRCWRYLKRPLLRHVVVVVRATHFGILCDPLLARFARDESSTHCARNDAGSDDKDGSCEDDPAAPCHVRDKEEDVDEEGQ